MKRTFIGLVLWINFICYFQIKPMNRPGLVPLYSESAKEGWVEQGRKESREEIARLKESENNFRSAQREFNRLLGLDLIQSELRTTNLKADLDQSERRNGELKAEIRKKIDELNSLLECLEDSHPCASPPTAALRRIIEDLKRLESK